MIFVIFFQSIQVLMQFIFFNFVVFRSYKRVFESRGFEIKKPWYGKSPLCKWPDPAWPSVTCGGGWAVVSPSSLTVGVASCVLTGKGKKFVCFCLFLDTGNATYEGIFLKRKEICLFFSLHKGWHSKSFHEATFIIKCVYFLRFISEDTSSTFMWSDF